LAKLPFENEGKINIFLDEQRAREFVSTRPALQEMLKGVLKAEIKGHETVTQSHTKKVYQQR